MMYFLDDSSDKRLEDEVQRLRDLLDDANRQISSMSYSVYLVALQQSAQCRLNSAVKLNAKEKYEIHSKCVKQNK